MAAHKPSAVQDFVDSLGKSARTNLLEILEAGKSAHPGSLVAKALTTQIRKVDGGSPEIQEAKRRIKKAEAELAEAKRSLTKAERV